MIYFVGGLLAAFGVAAIPSVAGAAPVDAAQEGPRANGAKTAGAPQTSAPAGTANDVDFSACDGYAAPKGKSDGIAREAFLFGAASRSADIRRQNIHTFGASGLTACDRALADPRLIDAFWLRRANLIQAKAVHSIADGKAEAALALTAESDALGVAHRDAYFAQSIGIGNHAVRAYALIALGRSDDASNVIDGLRSVRPWAQSIRELAIRLRLHKDSGFPRQAVELKDAIPLSPEKGRGLFWMNFLYGNYAAASEAAPTISFDLPKQRGGWTLRGVDRDALQEIGLRSGFYGAWAYAETVGGHADRAQALLAEANSEIDEIMAPPPPRADGRPPKRSDVEDHARRLPYARKAKDELALWNAAIAFRPMIAFQSVTETQAALTRKRLDTLPIVPDVLMNLPLENPVDKADADRVLEQIRGRLDVDRIATLNFDTRDLMELLPRPETPKIVPTLKPAGDGYFLSDSGLSRNQEGKSDTWTIRYTHLLAPIAAVEELAMLGAAQTARREGFDSLLLLSRMSITRTTNVTGMYVGSFQQNSGYEAQMRVRFVNAAALPDDLRTMAWRLIPAQRVIDDLSDRYKEGGLTIAW